MRADRVRMKREYRENRGEEERLESFSLITMEYLFTFSGFEIVVYHIILVFWQAGATTRKGNLHGERQNSEISHSADDEDGNRKKYSRRGPFRHKFLRALVPFWSSALPTLPVTAPSRRDSLDTDNVGEGRSRQQKSSRMDPRKILLLMAIMACMATMGILYYRIAQGGPGQEMPNDEQ